MLSMIQGCVMTLTQGHISNVKVTVQTYQNPCPDHNSSLPCWIWIIFHTIVFHDLDPRSYLQEKSQGHSAHIPQICVWDHNSSLPCWIWIIFHTIVFHDQRMCHDLDPRSHISKTKVEVTAHIPQIRVRAITPHCHVGSG